MPWKLLDERRAVLYLLLPSEVCLSAWWSVSHIHLVFPNIKALTCSHPLPHCLKSMLYSPILFFCGLICQNLCFWLVWFLCAAFVSSLLSCNLGSHGSGAQYLAKELFQMNGRALTAAQGREHCNCPRTDLPPSTILYKHNSVSVHVCCSSAVESED